MDTKVTAWLCAYCLVLVVWLYLERRPGAINYEWHSYLEDPITGQRRRPMDVIDLDKVIKPSDEYVNSTSAIQRLFDMAQQAGYANGFSSYPIYTDPRQLEQSGWPVANRTKCGHQLAWLQSQINSAGEYALRTGRAARELTQLMGTYGKPEADFLSAGSLFWPGQFEQCKRTRLASDGLADAGSGTLGMRYCLALLRFKGWPDKESGVPRPRVKMGICVPESCDTLAFDAHRHQLDWLLKRDLSEFMRSNLLLDSLFCLPDERSPVRQLPLGGRALLWTLAVWALVLALASIVSRSERIAGAREPNGGDRSNMGAARQTELPGDQHNNNNKSAVAAHKSILSSGILEPNRHECATKATTVAERASRSATTRSQISRFLFSFARTISLQQSWTSFKSNPFEEIRARAETTQGGVRVDLSHLALCKSIMSTAIVVCHSYWLMSMFAASVGRRIELNVGTLFNTGAQLHKIVDTFFLLFGTLIAYSKSKFSGQQLANPLMWPAFTLVILVRLAPVHMIMWWYAKTVEPYTGEGPNWDYGVNRHTVRGECMRAPWWNAFPFRDNHPGVACQPANWFIIALAQVSLVVPPIIYLLNKLPGRGAKLFLLAFSTLISSLLLVIRLGPQTSVKESAFGTYGGLLLTLVAAFENTGLLAGLGKLSCVAYGCHLGQLLYAFENGKPREWPRWLTSRLTLVGVIVAHVAVMLFPVAGSALANMLEGGHTTTMTEFLSFQIVNMIVWPVLNAILIVQLASVYQRTRVCRAMGHPFWHTANKLGFCLYLVHWDVLMYLITSYQEAPFEYYLIDIAKLASLGLLISLALAFFMTILIEIPLASILNLALAKIQMNTRRVARQPQKASDVSKEKSDQF